MATLAHLVASTLADSKIKCPNTMYDDLDSYLLGLLAATKKALDEPSSLEKFSDALTAWANQCAREAYGGTLVITALAHVILYQAVTGTACPEDCAWLCFKIMNGYTNILCVKDRSGKRLQNTGGQEFRMYLLECLRERNDELRDIACLPTRLHHSERFLWFVDELTRLRMLTEPILQDSIRQRLFDYFEEETGCADAVPMVANTYEVVRTSNDRLVWWIH